MVSKNLHSYCDLVNAAPRNIALVSECVSFLNLLDGAVFVLKEDAGP